MTERRAVLIGFAAASVVPSFLIALLDLPSERGISEATEAVLFVGAVFLLALPFSVLVMLFIGVPAYLLCRRAGLLTWWFAPVVGALVGAFIAVIGLGNQPVDDVLWKYVLLGSIGGLTFWAVWRTGTNSAST